MRLIKSIFLFIISTGWLLPMWLGFSSLESWATTYLATETDIPNSFPINSFPYYQFGIDALTVAGTWLSIIVCGWAIYLIFFRLPLKKTLHKENQS